MLLLLVGAAAATAVVIVLLASDSSSPSFRAARLPSMTVVYPANLKREHPLPQDRIVFLAQARGRTGRPGQSLLVREASGAQTDLGTDARLLNDLQAYQHPGRRLLAKRRVHIPGSVGAFELDSEYPDGNITLRQVDLIVRTAPGTSYHLILVGPAGSITNAAVSRTTGAFRPRR